MPQIGMVCDHSGPHSGATRYSRETAQLRLVVVCDMCGSECSELKRVDYLPQPELGESRDAALAPR